MGVSFETCLRRHGEVMVGRRCYVLLRRRYDIPVRSRRDAPLRRLGDVSSRRRWVFRLRRTYDVSDVQRNVAATSPRRLNAGWASSIKRLCSYPLSYKGQKQPPEVFCKKRCS